MKKLIYLSIILIMLLACNVSAFDFYGYTYDVNKTGLNNTNVSMEVYLQGGGGPPTLITTFNSTSNGTGWFNVSGITSNSSYSYKPVVRHYNSTTGDADYVSQSLPDLPLMEMQNISPIDFYLREGATINITAKGEQESLGIVNETAEYIVTDYNLGLEWDGSFWGYLNSSGNLIMLNPSFTENKSYFVDMTGIAAFDYVNSTSAWYFVNATHARKFIDNGTALNLDATYNLTCNASYNYSIISTIEYIGISDIFFVLGNRTDGNTAVSDFNSSTFECVNEEVITEPLGLLQWYDGDAWIVTNEFGYFEILKDPEGGGESWDISSPSIEGIENNGSAWFYGSATSSNITEFKLLYTDVKSFRYMVKDVALGYPIAENFDNATNQATIYLPADRNYSIMLYPDMSFPISYDLNNLSAYSNPKHVDIVFNTSEQWRWVGGYVNFGGSYAFNDLNIIGYLIEPGDMIFQEHPLPYNMSAWRGPPTTDRYNASVGFYNITLPGAVMEAEILLFAVANNGTYGAFRNITLDFSNATVSDFNFTLNPLVGSTAIITLVGEEDKNVTVKKASIQINDESGSPITSHAFTETKVDYSGLPEGYEFSYMVDVSADDNGSFEVVLLNGTGVERMNIFSQNYAPQKASFTAAEVATGSLELNLSEMFEHKDPDGGEFMDLFVDMIKSTPACDVPEYNASACSLFPAGEKNKSDPNFNPFKIVLGGGKISFVMRKFSNNITVHYKNVDMLASGPPDALFDSSANETETGSDLEMAWRFGSQGPEIYDEVLIGIPLGSGVDFAAPISLLIENLYDEDWNVIWNVDVNGTPNASTDLPDDYQDFNLSWFNKTVSGMPCSESNNTAQCYVNNATRMAWLTIPHFSGIGPTVQSVSAGNVTMNASAANYDCTLNCTVYFNVTNNNFTIAQSLHNITISLLDVNGNIANISVYWYNNSATDFDLIDSFIGNGTNSTNQTDYNLTRHNGSASTQHRYRLNITKNSNLTTRLNITYNITDLSLDLMLSLSLNCVEDWTCTAWSTCSGGTQTKTCTDGNACGTTTNRPALSQSCSSGGGGGGGGGSPTNPHTSKIWDKVTPGAAHIMKVSSDDFGIKQITIEVNNPANNVKITIEKLPGRPASIIKEITGKVYRYMEIRKENLGDDNVKGRVKIKFHVTRGWLLSNNLKAEDIVLKRFANGEWEDLKTALLSTDNSYAYYEAESPGFSYFAIGEKSAPVIVEEEEAIEEEEVVAEEPVAEEEAVVEEEEEAPEEEAVEKKKGLTTLGSVLIITAVIAVIIILVLVDKGRKKKLRALKEREEHHHHYEHGYRRE